MLAGAHKLLSCIYREFALTEMSKANDYLSRSPNPTDEALPSAMLQIALYYAERAGIGQKEFMSKR